MVVAGLILYQLRNSRPYITKDFDIVLSCIAIFAGGILIFQVNLYCTDTRTAQYQKLLLLDCPCLTCMLCCSGLAVGPIAAIWAAADSRWCTELWFRDCALETDCAQTGGKWIGPDVQSMFLAYQHGLHHALFIPKGKSPSWHTMHCFALALYIAHTLTAACQSRIGIHIICPQHEVMQLAKASTEYGSCTLQQQLVTDLNYSCCHISCSTSASSSIGLPASLVLSCTPAASLLDNLWEVSPS